jgi:hypothetical protein
MNKIYIVSDFFADEVIGGAELSTSSLLTYCKEEYIEVKSRQVTLDMLSNNRESVWIFTNFSQINPEVIPYIIEYLTNYHIIEYDYKFCRFRLPQHPGHKGECDCESTNIGQMIFHFYKGAKTLNWMSYDQMYYYHKKFPELENSNNFVLSSIFSQEDLETIKELILVSQNEKKNNEILLLGSSSWVKGFDQSREYCEERNIATRVVWNTPYKDTLKLLATHRGIVYLPNGFDTCPRWVIEAKLLGCKIIDNHYVQHRNEPWFKKDANIIIKYLSDQPYYFWNRILSNEE